MSIVRKNQYTIYAPPEGPFIVGEGDGLYNKEIANHLAIELGNDTYLGVQCVDWDYVYNLIEKDKELYEVAQKIPDVGVVLDSIKKQNQKHYKNMFNKRSEHSLGRVGNFFGGSSEEIEKGLKNAKWKVVDFCKESGEITLLTGDLLGKLGYEKISLLNDSTLVYPMDIEGTREYSFLVLTGERYDKGMLPTIMKLRVMIPNTKEIDYDNLFCVNFYPGEYPADKNYPFIESFKFAGNYKLPETITAKELKEDFCNIEIVKFVETKQLEYYLGRRLGKSETKQSIIPFEGLQEEEVMKYNRVNKNDPGFLRRLSKIEKRNKEKEREL